MSAAASITTGPTNRQLAAAYRQFSNSQPSKCSLQPFLGLQTGFVRDIGGNYGHFSTGDPHLPLIQIKGYSLPSPLCPDSGWLLCKNNLLVCLSLSMIQMNILFLFNNFELEPRLGWRI